MGDITQNPLSQQENPIDTMLDSIFSQGCFLRVHRKWIRTIGYRQALILAILVDQRAYWRSKGKLQPDGSFYKVRQEIADEMGTGLKDVDAGIKRLEEMKLVSGRMVGVPAMKYLHLDSDRIMKILTETPSPAEPEIPQEKQSIPLKGNLGSLKKERTDTTTTETTEDREETVVDNGNAKAPDTTLTHSLVDPIGEGIPDRAIGARETETRDMPSLPPHYVACIKSLPERVQTMLRDRYRRWPRDRFVSYLRPTVAEFLRDHPEWSPDHPLNAAKVSTTPPFRWPGETEVIT